MGVHPPQKLHMYHHHKFITENISKIFLPKILIDFFLRYAKIHIPIIASVSEHQPTTWVSFFFDLHVLICTFPAGLWFVVKKINDERVFGEKACFLIVHCPFNLVISVKAQSSSRDFLNMYFATFH